MRRSTSLIDILAEGKEWRYRSDINDWDKHELMKLEMEIEDLGLGGEVPTTGRLRDDGPPDWSA